MFYLALVLSYATSPLWASPGLADDADSHVAFRGRFSVAGACKLRMVGASGYLVYLDGKLIADGPPRFAKAFPEYQTLNLATKAGKHLLAIHAHNEGVTTRVLSAMQPFIWCEILDGSSPVPISWKCARLDSYKPRVHRISDILGWIDWTTGLYNPEWKRARFDDSQWVAPVAVDPGIGPLTEAKAHPVRLNEIPLKPIAEGTLAEGYGYEQDEPAARFFLAELNPKDHPVQGYWRRYDLGRVRFGRPNFTIHAEQNSVVEFALCEELKHDRVHAWIPLSGSTTCNFDHFAGGGAPEEYMSTTPKGGRYLEVHVYSTKPVIFLKESFLESAYYGEPEGSFECDDPLLNKIWRVGVNTVQACAQDSLVDCPTRERGEWTGDIASVATDICGVAFSDLSLSRRGLVQASQAARGDGLVAGVGPGDPGYLSTYAAQWVVACVHYWEITGDKSLLEELYPAAERNMEAFEKQRTKDGLSDGLGWVFVDWGYVRNDGPTDMALNLHYYMALKAMARWRKALGHPASYDQATSEMEKLIRGWIENRRKVGGWEAVGYHRAALALLAGLVESFQVKSCIGSIEDHLLTCFPNNPDGARLSDPGVVNDRIMTPYFCHFAFMALLQHGETDFVLSQYRKCWGWALGDGRTTWLEVFDTRWSHCHEWSGCPTWQLSRYVLGLRPRFDLGDRVYDLDIHPGSLRRAKGVIPIPGGGRIRMNWELVKEGVHVTIHTDKPITFLAPGHQPYPVRELFDATLPR